MRVAFGPGRAASVGAELEHLGLRRVLVLCTPGQQKTARVVADGLGDRCAAVYPRRGCTSRRRWRTRPATVAARLGADGCVAVGGGSTVGLGKAIALRHGLPVIAVPTTYAGSEMTPVWGITEGGVKRTGRDPTVLPRSVVYDPELIDVAAGRPVRDQRAQRRRARRGRSVRPGRLADRRADGRGGRPGDGRGAAPDRREPSRPRRALGRPARRLAVRRGAGRHHDVAAPQALPRAGGHVRAAARRDAHGRPAARPGLQRCPPPRRPRPPSPARSGTTTCRARCGTSRPPWARRPRWPRSGWTPPACPRSFGRYSPPRTRARAPSPRTPRRRCSTGPSEATGPLPDQVCSGRPGG